MVEMLRVHECAGGILLHAGRSLSLAFELLAIPSRWIEPLISERERGFPLIYLKPSRRYRPVQ